MDDPTKRGYDPAKDPAMRDGGPPDAWGRWALALALAIALAVGLPFTFRDCAIGRARAAAAADGGR